VKRRRTFPILVALVVTCFAVPAQAAAENPYWQVETNIPIETIEGEWAVSDDGLAAKLTFEGVNVTGQETTFTAGWMSPWVKNTHLEVGELNVLADPTAHGRVIVMTRVQAKGHGWGPWFKLPMRWNDLGGGWLWAGGASSFSQALVRYDWKMIGTLTGTTRIQGSAEVSVE
jgi:hypothetical protein